MSRPLFATAAVVVLALPVLSQVLPPVSTPGAAGVQYDIVYVRQPRFGDQINTRWPEVFHPVHADPGADLMLLHPDGSEEVLVDCVVDPASGRGDSITDPFVSFDAQWVYFVRLYECSGNDSIYSPPHGGSDIFKLHLPTREVVQLTHVRDAAAPGAPLPPGEFLPNTASGVWEQTPDGAYQHAPASNAYNRTSGGIFNMGPTPVAGGKIAFTSSRNGLAPTGGYTTPNLQLFTMDDDGSNVRCIAPMNIGSALHPVQLRDGRLMFSSYESQGLRDIRAWGLWFIRPDGRDWGPLVSSFVGQFAWHFATQASDESIVCINYYNLNNNGFGAAYRLPASPPAGTPGFGSPDTSLNPSLPITLSSGQSYSFRMPFTPFGLEALTPFTHPHDNAGPLSSDGITRVGKVTHPSAAPGGDVLFVWTPGPANDLNRPETTPRYDGGIYLMPSGLPGGVVDEVLDLVGLKNDPAYNEAYPRAVVPYRAVHGVAEPARVPDLPNDGTSHSALPEGTPFGLVGSSSLYKRESFPNGGGASFEGLDAFNSTTNGTSTNWGSQGADVGKYTNSEIFALRIVAQEPNVDRYLGPNYGRKFRNLANERLRILGEIPVRKFDSQGNPILDPEGNPDTSFLAKLAADTPFTFQTIDRRGLVLNMAQTWHQLRPGEVRTDCGGCHSHSQLPLDFGQTAAGAPGFTPVDLTTETPLVVFDANGPSTQGLVATPAVDVEFYNDIRPILQGSCVPCHSGPDAAAPGMLSFSDHSLHAWSSSGSGGQVPGDYKRLADDQAATWGFQPVIQTPYSTKWRGMQRSRYVRAFQARRSLLVWKVFGERLDGWSNADWPTETTPGDVTTFPAGANTNFADLDFNGVMCPPPGSGVPPLTDGQKSTIGRWIDLGCPIDTGDHSGSTLYGWFNDTNRPTLTMASPRDGVNAPAPAAIRFGIADNDSGIDVTSLSVRASITIQGIAPGGELAQLATEIETGVFVIPLPQATVPDAEISVSVQDVAGNTSWLTRRFAILAAPTTGQHNDADGSLTINGVGTTGAGPFPLSLTPGGTLTFDWAGPAGAGLVLAAGRLAPSHSVHSFGSIDIAGPFGLIFDGTPSANSPYRLDADGFARQVYGVPANLPAGSLGALQGVVVPGSAAPRLTAAFLLLGP